MSNSLYNSGRNAFLTGADWTSDSFAVALIDTTQYTVDLSGHTTMEDVPSGAIVAQSADLTNCTASAGVASADNPVLSGVSGANVEALIVYQDTGNDSTNTLIAYIDTANGLPFAPTGGDITIAWDSNLGGIFKL